MFTCSLFHQAVAQSCTDYILACILYLFQSYFELKMARMKQMTRKKTGGQPNRRSKV